MYLGKEFTEPKLRVSDYDGELSIPSGEIANYIGMDHEEFQDDIFDILLLLEYEGINPDRWVFFSEKYDTYCFTILGCGLVPVLIDTHIMKNKFISEYCYQFGTYRLPTQKKKSFLS